MAYQRFLVLKLDFSKGKIWSLTVRVDEPLDSDLFSTQLKSLEGSKKSADREVLFVQRTWCQVTCTVSCALNILVSLPALPTSRHHGPELVASLP